MEKLFYVYILTNKHHTVFYTGITNNLERRHSEHVGRCSSFTRKYNIHKLVYYENHTKAPDAIAREKQIKKWARRKKVFLIELMNPAWKDLALAQC
ncbi:MAG: GIY-YIG nuclease family protein [Oligoflexales bacterium]